MSASLTVRQALAAGLERGRSRIAVVGGGKPLSYADLGSRIREAAGLLRPAGRAGEARRPGGRAALHVGFCLGNRAEYVILYFATLEAGQLPLLLDASWNVSEIEAIRGDCGLDLLVTERAKAAALALPGKGEPIPFGEDVVLLPLSRDREPAYAPRPATEVCRFTSGTTGRPKCLEFSGHAVVSAARNWVLGTGMTGEVRTLCLAALSNGLAFNTSLLSTFLAGGELHFLKGAPLTRVVARRIAGSGITRLVAYPTLYRNFAAPGGPERELLSGLTHAISAGAPLWSAVREEFRALYGLDVSDYYGIAETGPCTFERDPDHHAGLGRPLPGVEVRIAPRPEDEPGTGEVLVRTASMASGYLNHPGLFRARLDGDGFYHSGDRGRIVDGRLHLVGGTRDHINVAGRKIDPTEIVAVVSALDGVEDAVAFPDEDWNRETLVHLVVVAAGPEVTRAAVAAACRARLAPYKVPGRISFVPQIPRNGIGKPRLALLREQLAEPNGARGAEVGEPRQVVEARKDGVR
ncbi:MAG: acyl--CoA ligase [Acidobacteria bacterium]|nr:acyl--CoA ligase [Acidobacteriota bacterium]